MLHNIPIDAACSETRASWDCPYVCWPFIIYCRITSILHIFSNCRQPLNWVRNVSNNIKNPFNWVFCHQSLALCKLSSSQSTSRSCHDEAMWTLMSGPVSFHFLCQAIRSWSRQNVYWNQGKLAFSPRSIDTFSNCISRAHTSSTQQMALSSSFVESIIMILEERKSEIP